VTVSAQLVLHPLAGEFAAGPTSAVKPVAAPFTGEHLHDLPLSTPADVTRVVAVGREAQSEWAQTSVRDRVRIIRRFHDLVLRRRSDALDLLQSETGKSRPDALEEVLDVALVCQYYGRRAGHVLRPHRSRGALPLLVGVEVVPKPVGVVGIIAPWNYPLSLSVSDAIPALLAGNAVVVKPDVQTSLVAAWAGVLLREAGLPDGLYSVVTGEGADIGPAVVDHVDHVMFTGSSAIGRIVAEQCARRLIGCTLELGGKNAMIVRADANPIKAADTAVRACFSNAGELCISMERLYVNDAVYDAFAEEFARRVAGLSIASDLGWDGDVGCLISAAHLGRVQAHVDDAVALGARVLAGGRARPDIGPLAFEPTLLEGVDESMAVCREETFGPVASLYRVFSDDEAVALANDTTYGLNASILTSNLREGRRLARRLNTGSVNVNEGYAASWGSMGAPMGGVGESGLGSRHGDQGLLNYTETQTIATQRFLGFGPQLGLDRQKWGAVLAASVGAMGRLRI
jgi:succinate-semialdehyde dehydrogenase/glutarate-semialdehyde dehydrogenase